MFFVRSAQFAVQPFRQLLAALRRWLPFTAVLLALVCVGLIQRSAAVLQNPQTATIVSAASNEADALAPESLATAYGVKLATQSDIATTPQPQLAGTTVEVAGRAASLLFVSPEQVNFLIPAGTPPGLATVTVRAGDGTISTGTTNINAAAPALFTAGGVVSGFALRVNASGAQKYDPVAEFDTANGQFKTIAIDLNSAAGDQVFLVFFLSGLRNADPAQVRVILGGDEFAPVFAGAVPGAPGLDQINLALPRELAGKGVLNLVVRVPNARPSNPARIEIGGGVSTLAVNPLSKQTVVAGETLEIEGTNLPTSNVEVLFEPNVGVAPETLTPTKMTLRVPFGVATGAVKISVNKQIAYVSPQPLNVVTSVSGFVQEFKDNTRVAVAGLPVVMVESSGRRLETVTNSAGAFLIRDAAQSSRSTIQIKGVASNGLGYEVPPFGIRVLGNRDNQTSQEDTTPRVVELKPNGSVATSLTVADTPINETLRVTAGSPNEAAGVITSGQVSFDTNNSTITCPGGASGCQLALNVFDPGRTPTNLPAGVFSSTIVQITPFGATLTPGGKLTFPNSDAIPAGTPVRVYRFDQTPTSATFGQFVDIGAGTISSDGQRLETSANAITQTSYYLISRQWLKATVIGHVVEADGVRPVRRAVVSARGQSTFTDGNGGFVLRNIPVIKANDAVTLEVSSHRADGTVSRTERAGVAISTNAQVTLPTDISLPQTPANLGPTILAPATLSLIEGETREFNFLVTGLAGAQPTLVDRPLSASLRSLGNEAFALRLVAPQSSAGNYQVTIEVIAQNKTSRQAVTVTVVAANANTPLAKSDAVTTDEDTPVNITLASANVGNSPVYAIVAQPLHGRVSLSGAVATYAPAANYNGPDSFSFRVGSGSDVRSTAVVSIAVRLVNDVPVISVASAQEVTAGELLRVPVTVTDVDGEQSLTFTATGLPPGASLVETGAKSRELRWTPTYLQDGTYTINLRVEDNGSPALSNAKSIVVTARAKWAQTAGPEGGSVSALLNTPGAMYAGTGGGVYRSTDNGQTWTAVNNGLSGNALFIRSLLAMGNNIFAGTYGGGIYRTTDNGQNWTAVKNGLSGGGLFVRSLVVVGNSIFAGTDFGGGVYRTTDNGQNWTAVNRGLPEDALVINSLLAVGNNILAGTNGRGVYRTTDNGQNWTGINNGLSGDALFIGSLLMVDNSIFAGTLFNGVYRTTDNGQNWTAVNNGLSGRASYVCSLLTVGNIILVGTKDGGLYRTTDNGQSWTAVNNGLSGGALEVYSLLAVGNSIFAGTSSGIYRTMDNGQNWIESYSGIIAFSVSALASDGSRLYVSGRQGVYRTTDNGKNWSAVNNGLPRSGSDVYSLLVVGNSVFAGTLFDGVYRSTNNGQSWTAVNNGLSGRGLYIHTLLAVGNSIFVGTSNGVYLTTDNGQNWRAVNNGLSGDALYIYSLLAVGNSIFAGTLYKGVYRTMDNGQNWTAVNNGLSGRALYVNSLLAVGNSIFLGTDGSGVYRTMDNGQSWTAVNNGLLGAVLQINSLLAVGNSIFAGESGVGVYRTTDNGQNWTAYGFGLANPYVSSMLLHDEKVVVGTYGKGVSVISDAVQGWTDSNLNLTNKAINNVIVNGNSIFAATLSGGVFRSADEGRSWSLASDGLPPPANVQSLAASGASLFAGTFGQGIYRSVNNGNSWTEFNSGLASGADPTTNPRRVNALRFSGATLLAATDGGVFRFENFLLGGNWVATNLAKRTQALLVDGTTVYAGTLDDGVYRSSDRGHTWQRVNQGLSNLGVRVLGLSGDGTSLYVGTDAGLYRSTDRGGNWTLVTRDLPSNLVVSAFATNGAKLFIGTVYGVFLSTDNGTSWIQINAGLLDIYVASLVVSGDKLIAGTKAGGVFVSRLNDAFVCVGISQQPASKTINSGQTATLTINPVGDQPIEYQWYQGASGDLARPITGANASSYTTPPLDSTTNYWVQVKNSCGIISSDTASVLINSTPQADLAITQTIAPAQPKPGENVTFTFTLTNPGSEKALAVTVTNPLPVEVEFTACSATGGGICGGAGNNRTVFFSEMAGNASATVTLTAKVKSDAGGKTLRNNASVSAATNDTNLGNNSDPKSVIVQQTSPVISSLNPNTAVVGGGGFTLTVNGSNFVSGAKVRWNGNERQTSFGSVAQLTAQIPASDLLAVGTANVTVANPDGQTSNSVAFTITAPLRQNSVVRVVASTGSVGSTVAVPIELVSQGDENALGFSLTFDPAILSNPQVALSNGASGAALNPNLSQAAAGRVGLALAMPSGQRFAAGVRQIVVITFTIAANTGAATASLEFGNQPIPREVSDVNANELGATYTGGVVTITRGFEADVAPRPNGNGSLSVTDWVLVGRFASGDLAVEPGSEFQRTDCAPRSTFGNGSITVSDWVQAGRYAAGLDPLTPAAGPTSAGALAAANLEALLKMPDSSWPRLLRVTSPVFGAGQTSAVTVELLAQGEENAVSFSLRFDARQWRFVSASVGEDARNAALSVNGKLTAEGQVGFALALPPGQRFEAGMQSVLTVNFAAVEGGGTFAPTPEFSDWPTARELADVKAEVLPTDWMPAALSLFTLPLSMAGEQGLAAGVVIRVGADGRQSFEPLSVFDSRKNGFVAVPIEVGDENVQVFLALFGTGWQNGAALDAIQVTVDGLPVEVLYAGAQGAEADMAQLNLRLPPALSGRGEVTVQFINAGRSANPVKVVIK